MIRHHRIRRHLANRIIIELSKFSVLGHGGARVMGWPMLHLRLLIAVALFQAILVLPSTAERRIALVIGNSAYLNAGALANPVNDATDTAQVLTKFDFEVILGLDLTRPAFEEKIRAFSRALTNADTAVLFYAGHGLQVAGHNYLIPVDAALGSERDLDFEAISLDFVLKQMEVGREGKTNIVFLDACRDNPLARNLARSMGTRSASVGKGLAEAQTGVGTFIAYSTQPGNVALDGKGRNSPFTAAFTARVQEPGRNLNAIMIDVRNDVLAATDGRQVPWDHSALTRDFYFQLNIGVKVKEAAKLPKPAPELPKPAPAIQYEDASKHLVRTLTGHKYSVESVAFSRDGRFALSGSNDKTMKLWDIESAKKAKTFEIATFTGHNDGVNSVAFSPDGKFAWSGSRSWNPDWNDIKNVITVKLWDVATGKEMRTFAVDTKSEEVKTLLDEKTHKETKTLAVLLEIINDVAFSPDWQFALSSGCIGTEGWNENTGKYIWKETKTGKYFWKETKTGKYQYDGDGSQPSWRCTGSSLKLWEVATGKELRSFSGHTASVDSVAFSPDGRTALSGSSDKTVKLWDVATGKEIKTFSGHRSGVSSVAFSPDGRTALSGSGSGDSTLKLWDVATGQEIRTLAGHMSSIKSVTFSPDGRYIMSGGVHGEG
jgi:WD40 repeat protein